MWGEGSSNIHNIIQVVMHEVTRADARMATMQVVEERLQAEGKDRTEA